MNWKQVVWWLTVVVLLGCAIVCLVVSIDLEKGLSDHLMRMGESIHDNPNQWEDVDLGDNPMIFHKNLFVSSGLTVDAAQLSSALLLVLIAFLGTTGAYKRIKKRT